MPIRLLSSDVSSKIAAGEVVERPASVVKELVENSMDAGAVRISVEIAGGGVEYIRVTDDGFGIPSDEVELAFERFATSKVTSVGDLEEVDTLGFRGEALPSIASVARVSIVTRGREEDSGTHLELADGEVLRKEPRGVPQGTSVTVRRLFGSLPARLKFLRSTATETSRIQTLVTRYALAYPGLRFQLEVEGTTVFASTGSGDLRDAVAAVYSGNVAQAMLEISEEQDREVDSYLTVKGMISPPSLDRANRSYISLFVNGRWVQNRMLGYALTQAYHGFMSERRHPMAVLSLTLPYSEVDVNVHPAKTEIRFRRENAAFASLQQAVRHTLTNHAPVPEMTHVTAEHAVQARPATGVFWPTQPFAMARGTHSEYRAPSVPSSQPQSDPMEAPIPKMALPALRVLGQVQSTYVAAEGPDGMYLIDQHAAHERVVFEKVRAQAISRTATVQSLLEPAAVRLSPEQRELADAQGELLGALGFLVEPFGDDAYLLRGVPGLLGQVDPAQTLLDVLDTMAEGGGFESWEERGAYSVACHSAIRAGKTLSTQEMTELARQLERCQQPNTCPHGRPTMIHLSSGLLEREFGRR